MPMAGRMRESITLLEPIYNDRHEESGTVEHPVRAEIRAARGNEILEAMQVNAYLTHRCWIRWRPEIKADWRVRWGDRELAIDVPIPDRKRRWIELRLVEREPVT